jgi:hypothetical protein
MKHCKAIKNRVNKNILFSKLLILGGVIVRPRIPIQSPLPKFLIEFRVILRRGV